MPLEPARFQALLEGFHFDSLFNELGWDHAGSRPQTVQIGGETFTLMPIAQKSFHRVHCWDRRRYQA